MGSLGLGAEDGRFDDLGGCLGFGAEDRGFTRFGCGGWSVLRIWGFCFG